MFFFYVCIALPSLQLESGPCQRRSGEAMYISQVITKASAMNDLFNETLCSSCACFRYTTTQFSMQFLPILRIPPFFLFREVFLSARKRPQVILGSSICLAILHTLLTLIGHSFVECYDCPAMFYSSKLY